MIVVVVVVDRTKTLVVRVVEMLTKMCH